MAEVFISGGTGYLGRQLIPRLLERGHGVLSIVRAGSEGKLAAGCRHVVANALDSATFAGAVAPADTVIHLTGTPKPAPWKVRQFRAIDKVSLEASVDAAVLAGSVRHFIYVSVAQPAPVMRSYVAVRRECEAYIARHLAVRTILRPWYVLGPGHWWPVALQPFYALAERTPLLREGAQRLGLVRLAEMTSALVEAVESLPLDEDGCRIMEVPAIRFAGKRP